MKKLILSFGLVALWLNVQAQCTGLTPVTLPFSEGFESYTGLVAQDSVIDCSPTYKWEYNRGGNQGTLHFDADALMGQHAAALAATSYTNDTSQLRLTINLTSYVSSANDIILSFFYKDNFDETNAPDKVWVRGSQSDSWIEILDWNTTANGNAWTFASFKLDSILSANSQSFSATTQVLWSQYDGSAYSNNDGFGLDEVMISEAGCSIPTGITASATPGAVTLDWNSNGTSWEIAYDTSGTAVGMTVIATSKPFTISGLATSQEFDFYVREICGSGMYSQWSSPSSVLVPCGAFIAPYYNNFDTNVVNDEPACWAFYETTQNPFAEVRTLGSPYSGSQQLVIFNSNAAAADSVMIISPLFTDLTSGSKEISMMVKVSSTDSKLIVGTAADQTGKSQFNAIDTIAFTDTHVFKEIFVSLTTAAGYNGTDSYIVLRHDLGGTYDYIYIDDFSYHELPTCPKPTSLEASNITNVGLDVSFDSRGGTSYEYIYGAPGFAQASGTVYSASTNPFTVSGLNGNTTYELLVRNTCGVSGNSDWSNALVFTTDCNAFPAPHFNDFETETLDEMPMCWSYFETHSSANGEVEDYRSSYSGGQNLQIYNGSSTSDTAMAITPMLDDITLGDKQVRFYAQTSDVASFLVVATVASPSIADQFTVLDTIFFAVANSYQEYLVPIDVSNGYNGTDQYVAFIHGAGTTYDYITIDDFNYETQPACFPTLTNDVNIAYSNYDSLFINWKPGEGIKWNVEVGATGFAPGMGLTNVTVGDTFAGISGLASSTAYDVYIKDSCVSGWSPAVGPISFATSCSPASLPFIEGFSSGSIPQCWESYSTTTSTSVTAYWKFSGSASGGASGSGRSAGSYAWVDGSSPSDIEDVTLQTPFVDVSSVSVPQLYFEWFSNNTTTPGDNMFFYVNMWDGAQWIDSIFTYSGDDNSWQNIALSLHNYPTSGPIQFEFVVNKTRSSASYNNDFLLDSVVVSAAPACPAPNGFTIDTVTATTAVFNMNGHNASSYDIEWGPLGFLQGSMAIGSASVNGVTTVPYTLTGLTPNTTYDVYMRSDCGTSGNSSWAGPITIQTPCAGPLTAGTYTIGASPTDDFSTFDSVASVLNNCGISGPVVFNIQPGTYTDALHLVSVSGVSSTNTITFNGSGADTLMYNGWGVQAAVLIDDVKHVILSNMIIMNTRGNESWGVLVTNNSDSVVIDNCHIEVDATITSSDNIPVLISASYQNDQQEGADVDYLTLSNSTIKGGYYAIALEGNGDADPGIGHKILNNELKEFYYYGIYGDDLKDISINGNSIVSSRYNYNRGIYMSNLTDFEIEGNKIDVNYYGLYLDKGNYNSAVTSNSGIVNNMVHTNTQNAVHLVNVSSANVFHNTLMGEAGFYMDNHVSVDIRNNIFASKTDYAFEAADSLLPGDVVDYNIYYSGGQNALRVDGNNYADLAALQVVYGSHNVNSLEGDPFFITSSDLHVRGVLADNAGDNTVGVTVDIDGDARPANGASTVDIGADEFDAISDDIAVTDILSPAAQNCGDSNTTVTVVVKNFGTNVATGFDVKVDVAGSVTTSMTTTYNGNLASLTSDTVSISGFNSILGGTFTFSSYTVMNSDQFMNNDTTSTTVTLKHAGPVDIYASDTAVCIPQGVTLWVDTAHSGYSYIWTNVNGNQIGTGDTLVLANVDSLTTVSVTVDTAGGNNFGSMRVGVVDTTIASANSSTSYDLWAPVIEAHRDVVIQDMKIYPSNSGTLIVDLKDTVTGSVVNTVSIQVNQTAAYEPVRVVLNMVVPAGVYELRANPASTINALMRNSDGGVYPYGDPTVFEVITQTFGYVNSNYEDYYWNFYDMTITSVAGCPRPASSFTINYGDNTLAGFTYTVSSATPTDATVNFDASSSVADVSSTYTWDFGDGNTGTGVMPTHGYTANGTYTVKLVVDGACGKDSLTQQVVIQGISLEENELSRSMSIYPNPTKENVNVSFDTKDSESAKVMLLDVAGRIVMFNEYTNLNGKYNGVIDLSNLPKGTYILKVASGSLSAQKRIVRM